MFTAFDCECKKRNAPIAVYYGKIQSIILIFGGVSKSMLTLNEAIIDVKKG